jgi:hypothetical protein
MKCTHDLHTLATVKIDGVKVMFLEKCFAVYIISPMI